MLADKGMADSTSITQCTVKILRYLKPYATSALNSEILDSLNVYFSRIDVPVYNAPQSKRLVLVYSELQHLSFILSSTDSFVDYFQLTVEKLKETVKLTQKTDIDFLVVLTSFNCCFSRFVYSYAQEQHQRAIYTTSIQQYLSPATDLPTFTKKITRADKQTFLDELLEVASGLVVERLIKESKSYVNYYNKEIRAELRLPLTAQSENAKTTHGVICQVAEENNISNALLVDYISCQNMSTAGQSTKMADSVKKYLDENKGKESSICLEDFLKQTAMQEIYFSIKETETFRPLFMLYIKKLNAPHDSIQVSVLKHNGT